MVVEISDWNDLDNVRNDLTGDYVLVNDLDSDTAGYTGIGDDFEPIGFIENDDFTSQFAGSFNGDGFTISDVVIEYDDEGDIALFASTDTGSLIENVSVDGSVTVTTGGSYHGGLVGFHNGGTIQNCVSHVDVTALDGGNVGGLVGESRDTVTDSYATGSVDGDNRVGGLVGESRDTVTDSYATGSVDGDDLVGGLVGRNRTAVTDLYATGSVEGDNRVGGLVGDNLGTIQTSYAVGLVTGSSDVGALVGRNQFNTELSDSYADEETTGQTNLTGDEDGSITNSYTLTTSEMQGDEASNDGNMDGFDFANVWSTVEPETIKTDTINGQITLDDVAAETATVILHNFSEPESIAAALEDGYPILLGVDKGEQLDSQNVESEEQGNIARTETDTDGNYSAEIPGATGDTIAIAVDFDDGTERYGRLVTTVLE